MSRFLSALVIHFRQPLVVAIPLVGAAHWCQHQKRCAYLADDKTIQQVCERALKSVVSVRVYVEKTGRPDISRIYSTSSGVVLDGKRVLTTCRAVGNSDSVEVGVGDPLNQRIVSYKCKVDYRDEKRDLAILQPLHRDAKVEPIEMGGKDYDFKASDKVVVAGHAWDYTTVNAGIISWPNRTGEDITKIGKKYPLIADKTQYIQHTAAFAIDDIGGPLIHVDKRKMIGLYFYQQLIDSINTYFAIPVKEIDQFLTEAKGYLSTDTGVPVREKEQKSGDAKSKAMEPKAPKIPKEPKKPEEPMEPPIVLPKPGTPGWKPKGIPKDPDVPGWQEAKKRKPRPPSKKPETKPQKPQRWADPPRDPKKEFPPKPRPPPPKRTPSHKPRPTSDVQLTPENNNIEKQSLPTDTGINETPETWPPMPPISQQPQPEPFLSDF